jgi:hypothetical protein
MALSPDRWEAVDRLYHAALAQPRDRRAAFLAEACVTKTYAVRRSRCWRKPHPRTAYSRVALPSQPRGSRATSVDR